VLELSELDSELLEFELSELDSELLESDESELSELSVFSQDWLSDFSHFESDLESDLSHLFHLLPVGLFSQKLLSAFESSFCESFCSCPFSLLSSQSSFSVGVESTLNHFQEAESQISDQA
jgi:hypothetical protein